MLTLFEAYIVYTIPDHTRPYHSFVYSNTPIEEIYKKILLVIVKMIDSLCVFFSLGNKAFFLRKRMKKKIAARQSNRLFVSASVCYVYVHVMYVILIIRSSYHLMQYNMIWTETDILNQMIAAEREKEEEEKKVV